MKSSLQEIYQKVLPLRLRQLLRLLRSPDEYLLLPRTSLTFAEDGLFSQHVAPFLDDPRFQRAYAAGAATDSWQGSSIRWRAFVACWAAEYAQTIPGDYLECGVNRGGLSRCVVEYVGFEKLAKNFFLVDTYSGLLPDKLTTEEKEAHLLDIYAYYKDNSALEVEKTFAGYPNVQVVKGSVPEILPSVSTDQVAYFSLDMNCVLPEQQAAEFFWERMAPGGIILHDDYGFAQHGAQRAMLDEFARRRGVAVLALPTGQGILFKPGGSGEMAP